MLTMGTGLYKKKIICFFKNYPLVTDYVLACFNALCVANKLEWSGFHEGEW